MNFIIDNLDELLFIYRFRWAIYLFKLLFLDGYILKDCILPMQERRFLFLHLIETNNKIIINYNNTIIKIKLKKYI